MTESEADLVDKREAAEQRRADASRNNWLVGFAAVTLLATMGQAVLFMWQLFLMRRTVDDATKAADAAKTSADASLLSQRAWVTFSKFATPHNSGKDSSGKDREWIEVITYWINGGQTPASNCSFQSNWCSVAVSALGKMPPPFRPDPPDDTGTMWMLSPGGLDPVTPIPLQIPIEQIRLQRAGKVRIFLWWRVDYQDILQRRPCHTEICSEMQYGGRKAGEGDVYSLTPVGNQNTAS